MKKIFILINCLILMLCFLTACNKNKDSKEKAMDPKTGMFFRPNGHEDIIYVINSKAMTAPEYAMIVSLQGIVAQDKTAIFIIEDNDDQAWIDEAKDAYGLSTVKVFDPWDLVITFADYIKDSKYVLYNNHAESGVGYSDQTINYATTIAGVENYLMVSKTIEYKAINVGLEKGIDTTESIWNTEYLFNKYKDKLNNTYLVHQNPAKTQLRDYAIAGKALCYYLDYNDGSKDDLSMTIREWAIDNAPILGWTENEVNFVAANSLVSKVTVAADWTCNLSFYSSLEAQDKYTQKTESTVTTAKQGKHYLCIIMSDGDNVQWMTNGFASSSLYYGSQYRGDFKMTWTTSPSLYDLAPNIINNLYENETANDNFIAGPSGVGYINASEYNVNSLKEYAAYTAGYMEKTDLSVVNFIDSYVSKDAYKEFAKQDQIKGGICSVGNYYIEGQGVVWENNKPFVAIRETLWRSDSDNNHNKYYGYIERVAQRINSYSTDPTTIEGYTAVVCHAWSIGTMEYISRFVEMLDDDVVLVNAEEFIDLISKNVPHDDVDEYDDFVPSDFDNKLAVISTEQYRVKDIQVSPLQTEKSFLFSDEKTANKWAYNCGGLQYDFAGWYDGKIKLDGSDLDDRLDAYPNSWMYAKFNLTSNDKFLQIKVNGGDNADTNYRVRIVYLENGEIKSKVLIANEYEKALSSDGWYLLNEFSPSTFTYDISEFNGKEVIVSIEQDDSGEGSGEIVNVNKVCFLETTVFVSDRTLWNAYGMFNEWDGQGKVVKHNEGLCLENYGTESKILCNVIVPDDATTFVISVRKFNRKGEIQDKDPKIVIKVNGEVVRAFYAENDYITCNADENPREWSYDFSNFAGQTVKIEIINIYGEHACFDLLYFE